MLSTAARLWRNPPLVQRAVREWLRAHAQWGFDSGSEAHTREVMLGVASWLHRAQDAWPDGGISSRYDLLAQRFQPQYPETTGYLIPTLLNLVALDAEARARGFRAGEWLLTRQLESGAIDCRSDGSRGGENPLVYLFDCGAILQGFTALYRDSHDDRWAQAGRRLADFLIAEQLQSGDWKTLLYFPYFGSHQALTAFALIDLGQAIGRDDYVAAGRRCLDVIRPNLQANGYITNCHFTDRPGEAMAFLHPLAYTVEGYLKSGQCLQNDDYVEAARPALTMLQRRFELGRRLLASHYDTNWKPVTAYSALDADSQIAALWFQFGKRTGDWSFISSALKMMDLIRAAISADGGIPGSFPVYGLNQQFLCINWAPKYFIDASLLELDLRKEAASW